MNNPIEHHLLILTFLLPFGHIHNYSSIAVPVSCTPDEVGKFVRRKDWYLSGNNVDAKSYVSVDECQNFCAGYTGCRSFDYQTGNRNCFLHKVVSSDIGVNMQEGANHIYGEFCSGMPLIYHIWFLDTHL